MSQASALEARGVGKTFAGGVRALAEVSFEVRRGETVALVGESGSGKTTLLRMFNRLEEPSEGEILLSGAPASETDAIRLRRATGYVQQEGGLLPHWSVAANVELVPRLERWDAARRRARSDELLRLVGLEPPLVRARYPGQLSGGQRQRVAFARALAANPPVVLMDEPFGALDALTRLEMQREFLRLKQALSKTMLLVTHDLGEAFRLADRIGVMKGGRLIQLDTAERLRSQPADPYVEALVAHAAPAAPRPAEPPEPLP